MFTANSMNCLAEAIGIALPGNGTIPAVYNGRIMLAKHAGMAIMTLVEKGITTRDIINEKSICNALACDMALGCSSNSVLHLLAIANEAGICLDLELFNEISNKVPNLCHLAPVGDKHIVDLYFAGGIQAGVDQLIKLASVEFLEPGVPVNLVGSLLRLNLIRNPGAAFGMGSEVTIVFTIFAMLATVGCLVFALPRITRTWHAIALGLLLAGITGNLVDRLMQPPAALHGHVIDMFQLQGFAIFNIADVCITAAAVLIIIGSFRSERTDDVVEAPAEEQAA